MRTQPESENFDVKGAEERAGRTQCQWLAMRGESAQLSSKVLQAARSHQPAAIFDGLMNLKPKGSSVDPSSVVTLVVFHAWMTHKEGKKSFPDYYLSFLFAFVLFGNSCLTQDCHGKELCKNASEMQKQFHQLATEKQIGLFQDRCENLKKARRVFNLLYKAVNTLEAGERLDVQDLKALRESAQSFGELSEETQCGVKMRVYSHNLMGRMLELYRRENKKVVVLRLGVEKKDQIARLLYLFDCSFGFSPQGEKDGVAMDCRQDKLYGLALEEGARSYFNLVLAGCTRRSASVAPGAAAFPASSR